MSHTDEKRDKNGSISAASPNKSSSQTPSQASPNLRSSKRRRLSPPAESEVDKDVKNETQEVPRNLNAQQTSAQEKLHDTNTGTPVPGPLSEQRSTSVASNATPSASDVVANARAGHLTALDKLASQLLSRLADLTSFKINKMLFGPPTPQTHEYRSLKAQFEQTRRILARDSPFLSASTLGINDPSLVGKIRTVNIATFAVSAFSGELGLRALDVHFLDVFVPFNESLGRLPGIIFLELKTQAFIAARRTASVSPYQAMVDLFPPDTEKKLLARHPSFNTLGEREEEFMKSFNSRREALYADTKGNNLDSLHERHTWDDFSTSLADYLAYHYGSLDKSDFKAIAARAAAIAREGATLSFTATAHAPSQPSSAARLRPNGTTSSPVAAQPIAPHSSSNASTPTPSVSAAVEPGSSAPQALQTEIPQSSQTVPTKDLYTRAKSVVQQLNDAGDTSAPAAQGRPWSQDEETTLLAAIDKAKGPYWDQIQNLHGPGGTVNEVLRERTQQQLKDKALSLKTLFVKAGIEIPHYLQVTSEALTKQTQG